MEHRPEAEHVIDDRAIRVSWWVKGKLLKVL